MYVRSANERDSEKERFSKRDSERFSERDSERDLVL